MALGWFSGRPERRRESDFDADGSAFDGGVSLFVDDLPMADGQPVSWQELVRHLGEEVAVALSAATQQLERLNRLEPGLVRSLAPLTEAVERARQAGVAAQRVLSLSEQPPSQNKAVLNLGDIVRAALTARQDWLRRQRIEVRHGFAPTHVFADASLLYTLVDELLLWAGQLSRSLALTVDVSSRSNSPRIKLKAWCDPHAVPEMQWRCTRWHLWHQLARSLGAEAQVSRRADHVKISISFAPVTDAQVSASIDERLGQSSVSAVIHGCRVLVIAARPERRAQCLQALAGYGLLIQTTENAHLAEQQIARHLPDAVIYDDSVNATEIHQLRERLREMSGTPAAFIALHEGTGGTEFHASTVGTASTGHVAIGALKQALGPALVFELCKVM